MGRRGRRPSQPTAAAAGQTSTDPAAIAGLGPAPTPSATRTTAATGCPLFPADNVWHADVSRLPVHRNSAQYVASIGATATMHPDFGAGQYEGGAIGIPVTVVPAGTRDVPVGFD